MKSLLRHIYTTIVLAMMMTVSASAQTDTIRYVLTTGQYTAPGTSWATAKNNVQDAINDLSDYLRRNNLSRGSVYVGAGIYVPTESTESNTDGVLYTSFKIPEGIHVYGSFSPTGKKYTLDGDGKPVYSSENQTSPLDRVMSNGKTMGYSLEEEEGTHALHADRTRRWEFDQNSLTVLTGNHVGRTIYEGFLSWNDSRQQFDESFPGSSYHVVWFAVNGFIPSDDPDKSMRACKLSRAASVDGFTITGGNASAKTLHERVHYAYGGGAYLVENAIVRNCVIRQNAATRRGGGAYLDGGGTVEHCYIYENQSKGIGIVEGYGGGVCVDHDGLVRQSVIFANGARAGAGMALLQQRSSYPDSDVGGANYKNAFAPSAAGCVVVNNTSTTEAGGIMMMGGTANHLTVVRNHCNGANITTNGRRYGRSGGLYIDTGGAFINSVVWGNTTRVNGDVQYAAYAKNDGLGTAGREVFPYISFSAFSNTDDADWTGSQREGVIALNSENNRGQSEREPSVYYPEFTNPAPIDPVSGYAGVSTTRDLTHRGKKDWTPLPFSDLIAEGIKLTDYVTSESDVMLKAAISRDLNGEHLSPRTVLGAYVCSPFTIKPASGFAAIEGGGTIETLFVDPDWCSSKNDTPYNESTGQYERGNSWDNPLVFLTDALYYAEQRNTPLQILVKQGTSSVANRYSNVHNDLTADEIVRLRDLTAKVVSDTRIYGGYYSELKGTSLAECTVGGEELNVPRNPVAYPSILTGNVTGLAKGNNLAHIFTLENASRVIIDGFKVYSAKSTPGTDLYRPWSYTTSSGAGFLINGGSDIQLRNILVANCVSDAGEGSAIYADGTTGLKLENVIVHNNSTGHAKPSAIKINGGSATIRHALLRGNIGALDVSGGATVEVSNSAFHANGDHSLDGKLVEDDNFAGSSLRTISYAAGCTVTGSNNLFDTGTTVPAAMTDSYAKLTHYSGDNDGLTYPIFVNPTTTIGTPAGNADVTLYGGEADFTPRNMNPMVNAASDDPAAPGTDMTACTPRNRGGSSDIGAIENTDFPDYGRIIYVRAFDGDTTNPGGDGYSWGRAINGNCTSYKAGHGFQGYDLELYPADTPLTGLQWAIDKAYQLSTKKDASGNIVYTALEGATDGSGTAKEVLVSTVDPEQLVEVWVGEGTYTRQEGFFMRNSINVSGGFPNEGNPGLEERSPREYPTQLQTYSDEIGAYASGSGAPAEPEEAVKPYDEQEFTAVWDFDHPITVPGAQPALPAGTYDHTDTNFTEIARNVKSKDSWSFKYSSQEETGESADKGGWAWNAFDDSDATFWHRRWNGSNTPSFPHFVAFDTKDTNLEDQNVWRIRVTNREQSASRYVTKFAVYTTDDETVWNALRTADYANSVDRYWKDETGVYDDNERTGEEVTGWLKYTQGTDFDLVQANGYKIVNLDFKYPVRGRYMAIVCVSGNGDPNLNVTDIRFYSHSGNDTSFAAWQAGTEGTAFAADLASWSGECNSYYAWKTSRKDAQAAASAAYDAWIATDAYAEYTAACAAWQTTADAAIATVKNGVNGVSNSNYDINNYANAYKARRVLTQQFPYYRWDGTVGDTEANNVALNPYENETVWNGFTIANGITSISHQRDGGAGVALRDNGIIENCIIQNCLNYMSDNGRGGGVFLNGGVIKNSILRHNVIEDTNSGSNSNEMGCYGGGVYMRSGTIYNTSFISNKVYCKDKPLWNDKALSGSAAYFEFGNFYHNTLYNNYGYGPIATGGFFTANMSLRIYNSIFYDNVKPAERPEDLTLKMTKNTTLQVHLSNNIFKLPSQIAHLETPNKINLTTEDNYMVGSASPFINAQEENLHLASGSPAINGATESILDYQGNPVTVPDYDADYTDRIKDCALDIGAYEYDGTASIAPTVDGSSATYYVSELGSGLRTGTDPANAACWQKLQKVLDRAGEYKYNNKTADVTVRLAAFPEGYRPRREVLYNEQGNAISGGRSSNPRAWSIVVPRGVTVAGGYDETFSDASRDILGKPTFLNGRYTNGLNDVNAFHVVTFTKVVYKADGTPMLDSGTKKPLLMTDNEYGRTVLDGLFIANGCADGDDETRTTVNSGNMLAINNYYPSCYGGAAIVPSYGHVRNCVLQDNTATTGGGALLLKPFALLSGSILRQNTTAGRGGAVYVYEPDEAEKESFEEFTEGLTLRDPATDTSLPAVSDPYLPYSNILSCTFVDNTADTAGGGVYFTTNMRMNSTVLWRNNSRSNANIAGQLYPGAASGEDLNPWDYPLQYCAVESFRPAGYNNLNLNTISSKSARWDWDPEKWNADMSNDDDLIADRDFYYSIKKYSLLARSGMQMTHYNALITQRYFPSLETTDIAGVSRTGVEENNYIEIGARAFGKLISEVKEGLVMRRLFVSTPENTDLAMAEAMATQITDPYYAQPGSSMAFPMNRLDDALEYIRNLRLNAYKAYHAEGATASEKAAAQATADIPFEIFLSGGTHYPYRTIKGLFSNTRANTFLVPEGVAIYGGIDYADYSLGKESDETLGGHTVAGNTFTPKSTVHILNDRSTYDVNQNGIIEGWGLEHQSILSGDVVNSSQTRNVFHVIRGMAAEEYVGLLPTGTPNPSITATHPWDGSTYAVRGKPIILDGLQITEGEAMGYDPSVLSNSTFYKGGAICIDGNWVTGTLEVDVHKEHELITDKTSMSDYDKAKRAVGYRDIPLIVRNSLITNNKASMGGAIFTNGELQIYSSQLSQNLAQMCSENVGFGSGVHTMTFYGRGGAVDASSRFLAVNSIFANNTAESTDKGVTGTEPNGTGGAIVLGEHASLAMLNCNVVNNEADAFPAIYAYSTNKGYTSLTASDNLARNPHQIVNTIFWGNSNTNKSAAGYKYILNPTKTEDAVSADPEAIWFSAYENGVWHEPKSLTHETHEFRATPYTSGGFIPGILKKAYADVDKIDTYNFNLTLSEDNASPQGPNFINPSISAGVNGYMISADWMLSRINSLVDRGWTHLEQKIDENTGVASFVSGGSHSGIYYSLSKQLNEESLTNYDGYSPMPVLDDMYMYFADAGKGESPEERAILRVSLDPNPTHQETYIDIGAYEYCHVILNPAEWNEVDILWVSDEERQDVGVPDGSTWEKATSDLQRAIETLLSSRNNHHKEIRLLSGNYFPWYTISQNMAFTINTSAHTPVLPEVTEAGTRYGVRSLTIRGGYSKEIEGHKDSEIRSYYSVTDYPAVMEMSERNGVRENELQHVFIITDARQRTVTQDNTTNDEDYVIPITFEGITFTNAMATHHLEPDDLPNGGAAIFYRPQLDKDSNPLKAAREGDKEVPKLTIKNCIFRHNGKTGEADSHLVPAVTVGEGGGETLIYNTLFADNTGTALETHAARLVNNTFANNGGHAIKALDSDKSVLYNSILWENAQAAAVTGEVYGTLKEMKYNAVSGITADDTNHNDPLGSTNGDAMTGPNFMNPEAGDYRVNPALRVSGKASAAIYAREVLGYEASSEAEAVDKIEEGVDTKFILDPVAGQPADLQLHSAEYAKYRDLSQEVRAFDEGLERGAYESHALTRRVLYVVPDRYDDGTGVDWENAYSGSQMQMALDAAALYSGTHTDASGAAVPSYIFAKGSNKGSIVGDLRLSDGVNIYGCIQQTFTKQAKVGADGISYDDDDIAAFVKLVRNDPDRAPAAPFALLTTANSLTATQKGMTALVDGMEFKPVGALPGTDPTIYVGEDVGAVCVRNAIVHDDRIDQGHLIDLRGPSLLYNVLVRDCSIDNGDELVALGDNAYLLNSTVVVKEDAKALKTARAANAVNTITYAGDVLKADNSVLNPFAPYFQKGRETFYFSDVAFDAMDDKNLWYQLMEESEYLEKGTATAAEAAIPESLFGKFVDFGSDRDLLGNPRMINCDPTKDYIDYGCFETWTTGSPGHVDQGLVLRPTTDPEMYGGNYYPHEGSVVYIQKDCSIVLGRDAEGAVLFSEEQPFEPGYLLVREGGSLYGQGNTVRTSYLAVQRLLSSRHALMGLPFAFELKKNAKGAYSTLCEVTYPSPANSDDTSIKGLPFVASDGISASVYDGEARSGYKYTYQPADSPCWQPVESVDPCEGWLLDLGDTRKGTAEKPVIVRFTGYGASSTDYIYTEGRIKGALVEKKVTLTQHDDRTSTSGGADFTHQYNMGWNLKALPLLISGYETGASYGSHKYAMSAPRTLHSLGADGTYSSASSISGDSRLSVGDGFFTQTATLSAAETLRFEVPEFGSAGLSAAPRVAFGAASVGIIPSEGQSAGTGYIAAADGAWFEPLADAPGEQVYLVGAGGLRLSLLSHAPVGVEMALGVAVDHAGSYTFALPDADAWEDLREVWLTDRLTGERHNLAEGAATVDISEAGHVADRFTIRLGAGEITETVRSCSVTADRGAVVIGDLEEGDQVTVVDIRGVIHHNLAATGSEMRLDVPSRQVYVVRVNRYTVKVAVP